MQLFKTQDAACTFSAKLMVKYSYITQCEVERADPDSELFSINLLCNSVYDDYLLNIANGIRVIRS